MHVEEFMAQILIVLIHLQHSYTILISSSGIETQKLNLQPVNYYIGILFRSDLHSQTYSTYACD